MGVAKTADNPIIPLQALLDMLTSFAELAALSPHPFTIPSITEHGPIVIKAGRHPIISAQVGHHTSTSFVPNDVLLSIYDNMHIITGPNGSGKVTLRLPCAACQ